MFIRRKFKPLSILLYHSIFIFALNLKFYYIFFYLFEMEMQVNKVKTLTLVSFNRNYSLFNEIFKLGLRDFKVLMIIKTDYILYE